MIQTGQPEQRQRAASFLRRLAFSPGHARPAIQAAAGVKPLVDLVGDALKLGTQQRERDTYGLTLLASVHWQDTSTAVGLGLSPLLELASSGSGEGRENGASAIADIALEDKRRQLGPALLARDGIRVMADVLREGSEGAREKAALALSLVLSDGSPEMRQSLERAGGISSLIQLAESGGTEARRAATSALEAVNVKLELRQQGQRVGFVQSL